MSTPLALDSALPTMPLLLLFCPFYFPSLQADYTAKVKALSAERSALTKSLEQLSSANDEAQALARKLEKVKRELDALRAEHEKLEMAAGGLKRGMAAAEQAKQAVQKELDDERARNAERNAGVDQSLATLEKKLERCTSSLEAQKTKGAALSERVALVTNERDVARRRVKEVESECNELTGALRAEKEAVAKLEDELRIAGSEAEVGPACLSLPIHFLPPSSMPLLPSPMPLTGRVLACPAQPAPPHPALPAPTSLPLQTDLTSRVCAYAYTICAPSVCTEARILEGRGGGGYKARGGGGGGEQGAR